MVKVMTPGRRWDAVATSVTCPAAAPVSVKVTLVTFAGIVTVGGKVAVPDPVALSVTVRPPEGAGSFEVTVTVVLAPERSVVVGAVNTSVTGCFTVSVVLAEIVTACPVAAAVKPKLASMVAVPAASALATPEPLIEATTTLSERDDQTTLVVKSRVVPSVIVPVAVNCTDSPTKAEAGAGESASAASSSGVMVTAARAAPPFKLAVMVAWPGLLAATGNSANSAPAATFTVAGTEAKLGLPEASVTAVATFGARETVTRSTPGAPLGSASVAGVMALTTGSGAATSIAALAVVLLTEAVTRAAPAASAVTVTVAAVAPAGTVTVAGTWTIPGALFASAIAVSVACAALSVAVRLPVAACCSGSGLGTSETIATACCAICTATVFWTSLKAAVMIAPPVASAVAVKVALVC